MGAALASQQGGFLQNKPALIDECGARDDHSLSSSSSFFMWCSFCPLLLIFIALLPLRRSQIWPVWKIGTIWVFCPLWDTILSIYCRNCASLNISTYHKLHYSGRINVVMQNYTCFFFSNTQILLLTVGIWILIQSHIWPPADVWKYGAFCPSGDNLLPLGFCIIWQLLRSKHNC